MPETIFSYEEKYRYSVPSWRAFPGQCLKIEGENGSGKSSYLKIFLQSVPCNFSYMGHHPPFESQWSLKTLATIFSYLLDQSISNNHDFSDSQDRLFEEYSAGQQNLFLLNHLLSDKSPLWIIDEGWGHLDAIKLADFEKRLDCFLKKGGVFLYTDHENRLSRKPDRTLVIHKNAF